MNEEITTSAPWRSDKRCLPPAIAGPRLRRSRASEYLQFVHGLQVAPATLAKLACVGGGPRFQKFNRIPLYPVAELDDWACSRLLGAVGSTSAPPKLI